jgi:phosphatidylglycerophosphate synthase
MPGAGVVLVTTPVRHAPAVDSDEVVSDRILTIPNLLSFARLLGVPLFLWLALGPHADGLALLVLMLAGISDYLDGKIARRYGLVSRIGQLLDPLADRLYILATVVALTLRDIIPLWLAVALLGRDVILALTLPILRRHGYGPLPVHFLLLLSDGHGTLADIARPLGWAFTGWGAGLYWWAGVLYLVQVRRLVRADAAAEREGTPA